MPSRSERDARWNARRRGHRAEIGALQDHRLDSYRALAAYLRKRGNLHMHWRRNSDGFGWMLIYQGHTKLCGSDRCVMIPLTITA